MDTRSRLVQDAETIDHQLRMIRREMRRAYEADERRVGLTGPQTHAMAVLAAALREHQNSMTIRELSQRMGLAQSTVSGLIERLERKKLVRRQIDPDDRRCTRVLLAEAVKAYLDQRQPPGPLVAVMERATAEERKVVLDGLSTLLQLLMRSSGTFTPTETGTRASLLGE